ncbi:ABC transporter substrate-binding protein [Paenibacillus radicis (ex Xue et al. 2023)]|uniref:ABC transporter substrate-binding protein n=1 Tax=Paenibacillus radicis (ex Xue et al. 2023) TaxID=2972489 RepID=A0ABT1YBL6_9BACL|nr:ABC transporter substrate-binding protein [Paenibacillus radicis (ex Xue et al. 2023)]MCR8630576.1 ABC transporter substrate-binding protein [Paenibacillus radicis (ex Xue et al. 2023)]
MKTKAVNTIIPILALTMVILSACDNKGLATSDKESQSDTAPIAVSFFNEDGNAAIWDNMESPIGKMIQQKTGVTLKPESPVGDPRQKISLIVASNEYPDLIYPKADGSMLVDAGAMLDLTPLIDKYAPNLKKLYGESNMKRMRWSSSDKSIYFLGSSAVDDRQLDVSGTFHLQYAVLKELGYPKIKTVYDFENAIKAYKDKYPTIDGKPTIGLSLIADDWRLQIGVTNPALAATGGPDDGEWYVDPKTFKATYHHTRPEEKEYYRWLNHMNAIGLLDPESFIQKYDQYKSKVGTGRVLGLIDQKWDYDEAQKVLRQSGKPERTYSNFPVTLNEQYKDHSTHSAGYLTGWGVGITKSAKDPVRIIKFLDYLASEEGMVLRSWGIEGINYTVENGKRVMTKEDKDKRANDPLYAKKSGIGNYGYPFPIAGNGVMDSTGNSYSTTSKEQIKLDYIDVEKETLKHYNADMWIDLFPKESEFPVRPYGAAWQTNLVTGSEADVLSKRLSDLFKKRVPEMILAKPEQFDAVWDAFQKDLEKAGVHKMEEEFTKLLQDKVKLWNE